jgi:hypothetical protein
MTPANAIGSMYSSGLSTIATLVAAMAVIALIETLVPLRARGRWSRAHLGPNLALTAHRTNAVQRMIHPP